MEKGINLSLTKSLAEFNSLLDKAIEAVSLKKLAVKHDELEFQMVGKYVDIKNDTENTRTACFWIGHCWKTEKERKSTIWLEFNAKKCSDEYWDKLNSLIGTSGKYYTDVDFEFSKMYMNAWVHFYLKEEYTQQFYDENTDLDKQKEILIGFISEVLDKL